MNSISFDGRLAADPDLRYTPGGEPVLSFRVASDIGFGERKTTNWFNCTFWGKQGESLKNYLKRGSQVTVYGQLTLREWQDKEGIKRLSPDVRANALTLQGSRDSNQPPADHQPRQHGGAEPKPRMPEDMDDDIPF